MDRYNWTPNQIADLTLHQQYAALGILEDGQPNILTFKTHADYLAWKRGRVA